MGLSPPVKYFTDRSKAVLLFWIVCVIYVLFCHAFASIHCCLVVNCCDRADLLALVCDVVVTFLCGILGQVWHLIVSIPDLCRLSYFFSRTETDFIECRPRKAKFICPPD